MLRLAGVAAACLANHIAHALYEEGAGTTSGIQNPVIHIHINESVHKGCNMVRGKHLSCLSLATVAVELIEEDSHDIFAIPVIGVDEVGNLADIVDEIVDGFLIFRDRHTDRGILLQEYIQLVILLLILFQSLRQGTVNPVMEGTVSMSFSF